MKNDRLRILLRWQATREKVIETIKRKGWVWLNFIPENQDGPSEWIWLIDPEHTFHYIEDAFHGLRYVIFQGPDKNKIAAHLVSELEHFDSSDILRLWDNASNLQVKIEAANALGVGAPIEPDSEFIKRITEGFFHSDSNVRYAAVLAAAYTQWDNFLSLFEQLSQNDPVDEIRTAASNIQNAYSYYSNQEQ